MFAKGQHQMMNYIMKKNRFKLRTIFIEPSEINFITDSEGSEGFFPSEAMLELYKKIQGPTPTVYNKLTEEQRKLKFAQITDKINNSHQYR